MAIRTANIDVAQERTKPRLEALLLADYATLNTEGKAVVCGIFDKILIDPKDGEATALFYLFIRTAEAVDERVQITILDPKGNVLAAGAGGDPKQSPDQSLESVSSPRHMQALQRLGIKLVGEGLYWIDVSYKGRSLGGAPLVVEYRKSEAENGNISVDGTD